ncbi:type II secretion system F family protein [Collinsella sp. AGMB00827]|uniref:Type II secretion system F family protein n=2 Tax=Collinsella ureilytica TaxID=2869515 RepID=A0ABS7MJM1_9ACTN|nr:type II secretion system F family protein [Collinsella urealyticum]
MVMSLAALMVVACTGFTWRLTGGDGVELMGAVRHLGQQLHRFALPIFERLHTLAGGHARASAPGLADVTEMIDVLQLGLRAGLSFDAALEVFCAERKSVLARLMAEAKLSWQMGLTTREEALHQVAVQAGVKALEPFAAAIGRSLHLGAPLAETLAAQGKECRAAHRSEVERQIERAPVKLLIPTGTLILPALLLSILGPLFAAGGMK